MEEYDIIVVGGGSGGSAVAGRLASGGRYRVCLIEAGGTNTSWRVRAPGMLPFLPKNTNWRFETVPQPGLNGRRGYQPRGKGLGGSSAINAMIYIRGCAWDYDRWAELGATGWSHDEVLPYFRRAEGNVRGADAHHGGDGPLKVSDQNWPHPGSLDFIEAGASLQLPRSDDFNGPQFEGVGLYQVTQYRGERWSVARGYVEPEVAAGRLAVKTGALVEKIGVENGRARSVTIRRGGRTETLGARGAVILSAGAFGTPQTLMLSGIGPADHLREQGIPVVLDRAAVGADLQDHIDYVSGYETDGYEFLGGSARGAVKQIGAIVEWLRHRTGRLTTPYAEAGGFARTSPDVAVPDVQFHFVPAVLEDHGRTRVKAHGFSCHVCVLRPESRGTVRLGSPDPRAAPVIDPRFLSDDRDTEVLLRGTKLMRRILEAPPLARHGGRDRHTAGIEDDARLVEIIRNRADTVYHPVGTARMGSDPDAVVDPRLKVRGLDGLYIADASVMPRIVSGNTNAPTVMIGERCAEFVTADLG
ncbi:glucose-methanol-choline oxidoreductase [Sphingomonas changnyeongensis]|uniref:Glucose-methanol-choline oxidoreductase n=1 Tax=Sphingomonas changnyeongensis TaxID=2698679 RepID=A0A7Z2NUJ8_9SPHN|nr:GMC family oxidoreductase N-terminal domain-containing protein [Sphingomonas changnyeongensis]QHL89711.1 glucose-methanol-choline oxidoreductase [Sphingomonas changnyeongensis]